MAVQKVNGTMKQGLWFERDTSILRVESTAAPFSMPALPLDSGTGGSGGSAEKVFNVLSMRGTIIGYNVVADGDAYFMFGHAAGAWDNNTVAPPSPPGKDQPDVLAELKAQLDALGLGTFTLTAFYGFIGANPVDDQLAFGHDDALGTRYR